jgi:hypothetical protein
VTALDHARFLPVIAFLRTEPAADEVASLMRSDAVSLTAVGLGEVVDHLTRLSGVDEEGVFLDLAEISLLDALTVDPINLNVSNTPTSLPGNLNALIVAAIEAASPAS